MFEVLQQGDRGPGQARINYTKLKFCIIEGSENATFSYFFRDFNLFGVCLSQSFTSQYI